MSSHQNIVNCAVHFWHRLHSDSGESRATRARLRRCATIEDALMLEATHDFLKDIRKAGFFVKTPEAARCIIVLAIALSRIENDGAHSFASALGQIAPGADRQLLLPARFGALMRAAHARQWDDLLRHLRRALVMLEKKPIHVASFCRDILFLEDSVLQNWTYQYWQSLAPVKDHASENFHTTQTMESLL